MVLVAYGALAFNGAGFSHPDDIWVAQTAGYGFRPLLILTYVINRHLGGWMLTNLALHLSAVLLLFSIVHRQTDSILLAFPSSAVLAVHPFAADAIASVSGRSGLLLGLAALVAVRVSLWKRWAGVLAGFLLIASAYGYIPSTGLRPQGDIPIAPILSQVEFGRHYLSAVASYIVPKLFIPVNMSALPLTVYSAGAELAGGALLISLFLLANLAENPVIRLASTLIFLNLLIFIFVPLPEVAGLVMDHRYYLAIAGASILIGVALAREPFLIPVALGFLTVLSMGRADIYRSGVSLWEDAIQQNPGSAYAHVELAGFYAAADRWDTALQTAEEAVRLDPNMPIARRNLASAYVHFGNFTEASRVMDVGDAHFKGDSWQTRLIQ